MNTIHNRVAWALILCAGASGSARAERQSSAAMEPRLPGVRRSKPPSPGGGRYHGAGALATGARALAGARRGPYRARRMLTLSGLRKVFGTAVAVDDLSLALRPGEVFGLLGPNGAGKTTTISMALGLLRPDSGSVELAGAGDPREARVRRRLGVAPQALALYDELTGRENIEFFGRLYGLRGKDLRARADALLDRVGLADRARRRVRTYSGGMKRRLNIAVGLVHEPDVLMLDEPTAGVDPQSRGSILDLVRTLRDRGRTIVYTTHYMEEAQRLCDRVAIMDRGRLLALDTVEGLLGAHGGASVVVVEDGAGERRVETRDPMGELARLLSAGRAGEPGPRSIRVERPDLESVFLALTGRSLRD